MVKLRITLWKTMFVIVLALSGLAVAAMVFSCSNKQVEPNKLYGYLVIAKKVSSGIVQLASSEENILNIVRKNIPDSLRYLLYKPTEFSVQKIGNLYYLTVRGISSDRSISVALELVEDLYGDMTLGGTQHTCTGFFCSHCLFKRADGGAIIGCECDGLGYCHHSVTTIQFTQ